MKKPILTLTFLLSIAVLLVMVGTIQAQTNVTLYAGEKDANSYGFGNSASTISPNAGPTLTFTSGESVTVTLHNVGTMGHNFAIVDAKSSTANVLWSSQIKSAGDPVAAGQTGSVTFTVGNAGNYYYICQTDGHVALGMWGNVKVNAAVPEFPATLTLVFAAVAVTALAAYMGKMKIKTRMPL